MDRMTLLSAFCFGTEITLIRSDGTQVKGIISSIEREDGSGYLFNVTIDVKHSTYWKHETVFVRCLRPH